MIHIPASERYSSLMYSVSDNEQMSISIPTSAGIEDDSLTDFHVVPVEMVLLDHSRLFIDVEKKQNLTVRKGINFFPDACRWFCLEKLEKEYMATLKKLSPSGSQNVRKNVVST